MGQTVPFLVWIFIPATYTYTYTTCILHFFMCSNGFKSKIIMIEKSIAWELSLPVNFDTCVDDHVCKKIRMPHFIISCEQSSVQYYLYRTSTNAFNSIVSVCDENTPQH